MEDFVENGKKQLEAVEKLLKDIEDRFKKTMKFFSYTPKNPDNAISDFFNIWRPFCQEFKDIWTKEVALLQKKKYVLAILLMNFHQA
jgi:hypothetical protein